MSNFGENVRRLREARHLSQEELARLVGVSAKGVYGWERMETNNIRGMHLRKLAEVLGLTMEQLLKECGEKPVRLRGLDSLPVVVEWFNALGEAERARVVQTLKLDTDLVKILADNLQGSAAPARRRSPHRKEAG